MTALWIGTADGMEAQLVPDAGWPFLPVSAAAVVGAGRRLPLNVARLLKGVATVWRHMGTDRPDVALVTGGYVSVPLALAAWARRVPLTVYLPDVRPGKAVAFIARLAQRVLTTSEAALPWLPAGRTVVTGYPVRPAVRTTDRAAARGRLGLEPDDRLLLVFGGSQGARRINLALLKALDGLLTHAGNRIHIFHISGNLDRAMCLAARDALPRSLGERYRVEAYLDGEAMATALNAADLVVSRAGAATLGEYPACGLPSLLVPLPIASGHQTHNAQVLSQAGAARVVPDAELDGPRLLDAATDLLTDPDTLTAMRRAARELDRPDAADAICRELRSLAA